MIKGKYVFLGLIVVVIVVMFLLRVPIAQGLAPITEREKIMRLCSAPEMIIDKDAAYIIAILKTNYGSVEIELFARENPITVNNFVFLVQQGFYDGLIFHRVIDGFMIQAGCPLGVGTGGPGYRIPCEFRAQNRNDAGTISMANAGPNTGGSQFFINLVDNNFLDTRHPAFGRVIKGMDVVKSIGRVKTGPRDRPVEDVIIENIKIKTAGE
jgi:peptidylprolyl isomerase